MSVINDISMFGKSGVQVLTRYKYEYKTEGSNFIKSC